MKNFDAVYFMYLLIVAGGVGIWLDILLRWKHFYKNQSKQYVFFLIVISIILIFSGLLFLNSYINRILPIP